MNGQVLVIYLSINFVYLHTFFFYDSSFFITKLVVAVVVVVDIQLSGEMMTSKPKRNVNIK